MTEQILLTPEEAAELLRITPQDVVAMIEDGALAGLQIRGHWRVTSESITQFLSENLRAQNLKALSRKFSDRNVWAKLLEESPTFKKQIENEQALQLDVNPRRSSPHPNFIGRSLRRGVRLF